MKKSAKKHSFFRDFFVPHEGNNHHPRALHHSALAGYSAGLILLKVLAVFLPIALPFSNVFSSAINVKNIVTLTNQAREKQGLSDLKTNTKLMGAAQAKANDMIAHQYFAHKSPQGMTPWDFIRRAGYGYDYAGENLAVHYTSAEEAEGGWMTSPTHRANILNTHYQDIGIGVGYGEFEGTSTIVVVQMFGTPTPVVEKTAPEKTAKPVKAVKPLVVAVAAIPPEAPEPVLSEETVFARGSIAVLGVTNGEQSITAPVDDVVMPVRMTYFLFILFLGVALIIGTMYQLHFRKASVYAHALGVIGLALCLALV